MSLHQFAGRVHVHLVVENLGLSRFGLWNQGLVEDIEDILADLLQLGLDLLAVIANGRNVLLGSLGLLLLLDGGDDAPGGTTGSHDVFVCDGEEVTLIHTELATKLKMSVIVAHADYLSIHLGNLLHVVHHLIVSLSLPRLTSFMYIETIASYLLAEPGQEGLRFALFQYTC